MYKHLNDLEIDLKVFVGSFYTGYRVEYPIKDSTVLFVLTSLDIGICGVYNVDKLRINLALQKTYPHLKLIFITTNDNLTEYKSKIIFDMMESG